MARIWWFWGLVLPGVAWAGDKDGDGVPNKTDQCKEVPEDVDEFEDQDGCPDADNDQDGIPDESDRCANEPEDVDEFQDSDGCPDPDNDGDGVLDAADQCADDLEDKLGALDGCPDTSFKLLTEDGFMPAVGELANALLNASAQAQEGCDSAAAVAKETLGEIVDRRLSVQWEGRLKRAPEGFDPQGAIDLLGSKAEVVRQIQPAFDIWCKEHPGWTAVSPQLQALVGSLPPAPAPPPPKKGKKK